MRPELLKPDFSGALTTLVTAQAGAAPTPATIGTAQAVPATTRRRLNFVGGSSLMSFRSVILVPLLVRGRCVAQSAP